MADENYGKRKDDGLEVSGPGGWKVKANGASVAVMVVIIGCAGAGLYFLRDHDAKAAERGATITKQVDSLKESIEVQTYVLTLDEKQRRELRMDMPDALRRKVGR
jgi:hypothetical protein